MSVNRHHPHVFVLPEDDANRQIANGFLNGCLSLTKILILKPSGGWLKVLSEFASAHIPEMRKYVHRHMVLLIDFDEDFEDRMPQFTGAIPPDLAGRVFVVGAKNDPESLRNALAQSFETIGLALAQDCRDNTTLVWSHNHLQHNEPELIRLRAKVRPMLFD